MLWLLWCRRSTPSPHSLSPHVHDEVDIGRNRLSPSFQTGSLQRPLVPASEQQFQQQTLMKVYQQPASFPAGSSLQPVVQSNGSDASLSQQQYVDGGVGSVSRQQQQQQPVMQSYQEQQIITETHQLPAKMTATYSAPQSTPSSLSSQPSSRSTGGKQVRVLDASGRDVQVHSGFDGTDLPVRQERTTVQQSSVPSQSKPASTASAADTSAYNDLESIMAEFDVSYLALGIFKNIFMRL